MGELQSAVEQGMAEIVVRGVSPTKIAEMIKDRFNVSYNQARRLVRTELNYIRNQAALDRYIAAGCKKYKFLATIDDKTCLDDEGLNGKVFGIDEKVVGVNFPPTHPNCRCSILPVVEV